MRNVQIVPLQNYDRAEVDRMLNEYSKSGEICKPMEFLHDENTTVFIVADGRIAVGMIRTTRKLWRECHGKVGISIRPSLRGSGYGAAALSALKWDDESVPTACVDVNNIRSIRMFEGAGWVRSGRVFDWKGNRKAVEFVNFQMTGVR